MGGVSIKSGYTLRLGCNKISQRPKFQGWGEAKVCQCLKVIHNFFFFEGFPKEYFSEHKKSKYVSNLAVKSETQSSFRFSVYEDVSLQLHTDNTDMSIQQAF